MSVLAASRLVRSTVLMSESGRTCLQSLSESVSKLIAIFYP